MSINKLFNSIPFNKKIIIILFKPVVLNNVINYIVK